MDMLSTVVPEVMTDYLTEVTNSTMNVTEHISNVTEVLLSSTVHPPVARKSSIIGYIIKLVYIIGIIGNAAAIIVIRRGEKRVRNRKHLLMLTTLAVNDLVALIGMLCLMLSPEIMPSIGKTRGYCAARVVLRVFGIGSVCIAVTMALERYLALTRPFLYQKQVTYCVIRIALLVSWIWAAVLTCAPIMGLGLYYDDVTNTCVRYRNARTPTDFAYGIVYVVFGTFLCVILVYCNLAVIRALYAISTPRPRGQPAVRRVSRSSCQQRQRSLNSTYAASSTPLPQHNVATAEEVFFSRLMATLSVLFMICWLPQMITSALYLSLDREIWPRLTNLAATADVLVLLNYVLNPLLYVLMRRIRISHIYRSIVHCFKWQSHKSSTESMKTSCCPQETLLVSENSLGAEMKPLKPVIVASNNSDSTQGAAVRISGD